jgi:multidrug efflux pump subunit AcrB
MEANHSKDKKIFKQFALTKAALLNVKTVLLITFIIFVAGISAYRSMPKEAFPELKIPQIYVGIAYPGAGPKVIEDKITRPIEKEINTIVGLDKLTSTSIFGYATIIAEFKFNITPTEALRKVKDAVDKARSDKDFPRDLPAEPNIFEMNFSEFPIMNINLSGNYSIDELNEYAKYLEDAIEELEDISKVEIRGVQKKELRIAIRKHDAEARMVSFQDIENAISSENITMSAGEIKENSTARTVRIEGEFKTVEEVKNIIVKRDYFDIVYLKDVADVSFGDEDTTSYARQLNPRTHKMESVVMLDVIKRSGTNLLDVSDSIFALLDHAKTSGRLPSDIELTITNDMSFQTRDQVSNLENSIISGVILVVLVLLFFLGLRNALFVGIAIPLSMFMSFMILDLMGITLNIMVLFSLVLALGMLVDNGIIIIENIYRWMDLGYKPFDAVRYAVGEVAWPIISSTATTVAAFVPLALWPGLMGEFMKYLPITLMITLSSSLFVALVINPVLAMLYMRKEKQQTNHKRILRISAITIITGLVLVLSGNIALGNIALAFAIITLINVFLFTPWSHKFQNIMLPRLEEFYSRFLQYALYKKPKTVFFGTFALLFLSIIMVGLFTPKVLFFPENEPNYINIFVELPIGTDIKKTNNIAQKIEYIVDTTLSKYDRVFDFKDNGDTVRLIKSVISQVGEGTSDPMQGPAMGNTPHKARITVTFAESLYRKGHSTSEIMKEITNNLKGKFTADVKIIVDKEQNGPPQQPPINIELVGENYDDMIEEAERMKVFIDSKNIEGIDELRLDVETGKPELPVYPDRGLARRMDVSTYMIAEALRTAIFGKDISTFKIGEEEYDINLRYKEDYRNDLDALLNQKITFRDMLSGQLVQVPVRTVIINPQKTSTYSAVKRKNLNRVVTIFSGVSEGFNPNETVDKIKHELINYKTDKGISFKFTGQMEDQAKEMAFLSKALLIAVFLIFLIIVSQFNSYSSPLIIMFSVLFSLIGVFLGLVFTQMEFVIIMTMIGIISLAGVVVNNAIVLIDYTNLLIKQKRENLQLAENEPLPIHEVMHAIAEAGRTRLRPVLLTAITTLLGLIPLAIGFNFNFITFFASYDANFFIGGDNVQFFGPLSWTVIFGLTFATFLTLVVVPVMYLLLYRVKRWLYNKAGWSINE